MNIVIICRFPFPIGYSGTNRIISYSRGLIELGCQVSVLVLCKTEKNKNAINKNTKGIYQGIYFEYIPKSTIKSESKIGKAIDLIRDSLCSFIHIFKLSKDSSIDVFLISSDLCYDVYVFSMLGRKNKNQKVFWIVDEFPIPIRYGRDSISLLSSALFRLALRRLNGQISMTKIVNEYYKNLAGHQFPSLIMPMTVEPDRFVYLSNNIQDSKTITYIGNMEIYKDSLDILIKAYYLFWKERKDYELCLVGDGKDTPKLKKYVNQMGISESVIFTGSVNRDEIPCVLSNSSILILARTNNKRAMGGFPTKLGEYLASGKPVIVTNVGEISEYLTDKQNAYIIEPNNIEALYNCFKYVADHYEEAINVGLEGKKLAEGIFNYKSQAIRMYDFIRVY